MNTSRDNIEQLAAQLAKVLIEDDGLVRAVAVEQLSWLTIPDLMRITGFGRDKIMNLHKRGKITLFRVPDSMDWRTTRTLWKRDEEAMIKDGLSTRNQNKYRKPRQTSL